MFIVSFFGGLGSQMEQYAFYLALKKRYPDTMIKAEINKLVSPHHNGFELKRIFGIELEEASNLEISALCEYYPENWKFAKIYNFMHRVRRKIVGYKDSWLTPADPSAYYDEVFHLSQFKSYYFFGNWGHENYFLDVQPEILDAFTFPPLEGANAEIAERIKQTNAVSIHVRHGDYTAFGFPILTLGYYKKAVEIIREKVESPVFYVFSDDKEYIKQNFEFLQDYEVVDINFGEDSYRDMQLMSLCKHNIVANSTFSTWGAKLNQNKDKIIIAPRYHVELCHYPMGCKSWIHLDNKNL